MFRNNKNNYTNNSTQAIFLSTKDEQIRRADSAGSTASSSSAGAAAGMSHQLPPPLLPPAPMGLGEVTPYPSSSGASAAPVFHHYQHQQQSQGAFQPPAYNGVGSQTHYWGPQHHFHQANQNQPMTFHPYGGGVNLAATANTTATAATTPGPSQQQIVFTRKAVIPPGALLGSGDMPPSALTSSRAGAVAPPPPMDATVLQRLGADCTWPFESRTRRTSLESADVSSVHSSPSSFSLDNTGEKEEKDLNETYSRNGGGWTVTSSSSAPPTTKTSPTMAAVPIHTQTLWAAPAPASGTSSMPNTPNLSFRLDSNSTGKPILPPPAAPVLRPKKSPKSVEVKPLLDLFGAASATPTPLGVTSASAGIPPPEDSFQLPPSLAQQASRSCSPDPLTVPSSVVQTPKKKMIPGAADVADLELDFLRASRKELPAATWGDKKEQTTDATPIKEEDSSISAPAATAENEEEEQPIEEETLFKTHRYRGPRHCRACRFHSKSLNSNVVVTRDLNQKYKVSLFCKVCNVQFQDCVDDSQWQKKWDDHCKTQSHRRCALSSGPELRTRGTVVAAGQAVGPAGSRTSGTTAPSGNGGFVMPAPRSQQQQQQLPVPSTPDRKICVEEPTTVPQRPVDRPLPPPAATTSSPSDSSSGSPIKFGIIGRTVSEIEDEIKKVSSWASVSASVSRRQSLANSIPDADEQEEVVYSSPFSF